MRHFGDITKLNGAELPAVDVITGGSPCQNLSVAGNREGLAGEQSKLFLEQVRIVKEMREEDIRNGRTQQTARPRWMVWENVPGALSSSGKGLPKGEDFKAVLEEIVGIVEEDVPDLRTVVQGGWTNSGCVYSGVETWSIAWRIHDGQFWGKTIRDGDTGDVLEMGTPQRRRRISLVADYGGMSAPEILFEQAGRSGDFVEKREEGKEASSGTGESTESSGKTGVAANLIAAYGFEPGVAKRLDPENRFVPEKAPTLRATMGDNQTAVVVLNDQGGSIMNVTEDVTATLRSQEHGHQPLVAAFSAGQGSKARTLGYHAEVSPSLKSTLSGGNTVPSVVTYDARGNGDGQTVCTITGDHENRVTDYTALCIGNGQLNQISMAERANTLDTMHDQQAVMVSSVDCRNLCENEEVSATLQAKSNGGYSLNYQNPIHLMYAVDETKTIRRLTPLECERLQGYPDFWTLIGEFDSYSTWKDEDGNEYPIEVYKYTDDDGKKHKVSDTARYRALGNSICLPYWHWLLQRISNQYEGTPTLGSLFDGIGGFPLCWERINGKGTAVWASEIEPFCVAVTKHHFPEEETA